MKSLWDSAPGLLFVTGALLGLTLPFGKLAAEVGIPAIMWAFEKLTVSSGIRMALTPPASARRHSRARRL